MLNVRDSSQTISGCADDNDGRAAVSITNDKVVATIMLCLVVVKTIIVKAIDIVAIKMVGKFMFTQ